jgi:hypothetical protein
MLTPDFDQQIQNNSEEKSAVGYQQTFARVVGSEPSIG